MATKLEKMAAKLNDELRDRLAEPVKEKFGVEVQTEFNIFDMRPTWGKRSAASGSKYGAKRVTVDGITFDCQVEADRYMYLALLERAGEIHTLTAHPRFALEVGGIVVGRFWPDFEYYTSDGERVVEDVKGYIDKGATVWRLFKLKAMIFYASYRTPVTVVTRPGRGASQRWSCDRLCK